MSRTAANSAIKVSYPWMFGKSLDIWFFYVPILLGVVLLALSKTAAPASTFLGVVLINALGAGPFHQGATLFAFCDKENRKFYSSTPKRFFVFFVAPFLVVFASIFLAFVAPTILRLIFLVWSLQHFVQQNVGLLLLYHNHGKGEAIVPRPLEVRTQQAAGVMFTLIFFFRDLLKGAAPSLMLPLITLAAGFTLYLTWQYLSCLRKQMLEGAYLNMPALIFWSTSMLALWPLAFVGESFNEGYLIPITVHWFQYNGLNYVLVKNKYRGELASNLPTRHALVLFFTFCSAVAVFMLALSSFEAMHLVCVPWQAALILGSVLGIANAHYFMDAFLWKFREPYQRQAILPHLLAER